MAESEDRSIGKAAQEFLLGLLLDFAH
jgi:hypothetical protein